MRICLVHPHKLSHHKRNNGVCRKTKPGYYLKYAVVRTVVEDHGRLKRPEIRDDESWVDESEEVELNLFILRNKCYFLVRILSFLYGTKPLLADQDLKSLTYIRYKG